MAISFNNDRTFVLKRTFYREQHYLLDLFHSELGRFRASARIAKTASYRFTDQWALFQEILIDGHRKSDLASVWRGEPYRNFPLAKAQHLAAYYLNELLLGYLPADDPAPEIYQAYISALTEPSRHSYRLLEFQLIEHLGLVPQINGDGDYYLLSFEHSMPILNVSNRGFDGKLIEAIKRKNTDLLGSHIQTKSLFQQILHHQCPLSHKTRNISRELHQLSTRSK
ncbi:recombination protein O N-terminal domain-containing protein [Cardiobacteriaceae bacterium TAE3-ERU3]|nr:recombination protein O N-terminal domain-containing protein [Cardiobacteriaceae bacterium TAE3-ERU3]